MNKVWKVLLPLVLVIALLAASVPAFAAGSPTVRKISEIRVRSSKYNGKVQTPRVKVIDTDGRTVSTKYYKVTVTGTPKDAGTYKVKVTAKAPYTGTKTGKFIIQRISNPFTIRAGKTTFEYDSARPQITSIKVTGVKENAKRGKWYSTSPKVYVWGGKLIVAKGFSGTATISVSVLLTKNYKYTKKSIKITVNK